MRRSGSPKWLMPAALLALLFPLFAWLTPAAATTMTFTDGLDPEQIFGGGTNPSASSLKNPYYVLIDPVSGKVFVSDTMNGRVLRYASYDTLTAGAEAEMVFGQPDLTSNTQSNPPRRNGLHQPMGLALDGAGNLWVADNFSNRVTRYTDAVEGTTPGPDAVQVLGQTSYTTRTDGTGLTELRQPFDVALDSEGNLYVADSANCRVVRYDDPLTLAETGASASVVLGDTVPIGGPTNNDCDALTQTALGQNVDIAIDSQDRLYVADKQSRRIMRWDDAPNLTTHAPANGVIGPADYTSTSNPADPVSGSNFLSPWNLALDADDGLWVSDLPNQRVLYFADPWTIDAGGTATTVLGPETMTTSSPSDLAHPGGMAVAPDGSLWVTEVFTHKVWKFVGVVPPTPTPTFTPSPTTPSGGGGGGGAQATATPVPPCTQPATLNVSPATLEISAGGTQTIDLTLSNPCSSSPSPRSDVLVSLSPGLGVGNVSERVTNLGTRAAIENVVLERGEQRNWQISIVAPPNYQGNPQFVTELYSNGAVVSVRDSLAPVATEVAATPEAMVEPTATTAAVAAAVPQPTSEPVPAVLPNTAGGDVQLWLLLLLIGGIVLLALGMLRRTALR